MVVGTDPQRIVAEAEKVLSGRGKQGRRPEFWDGRAAVCKLSRVRNFYRIKVSWTVSHG